MIAHVDGRKESMSEKVMAGLAGGRWVLTRRYVDKCVRRGSWLPSPALFITSEAVVRHRRAWHQEGPQGSVFHGMKAVLLLEDGRKNNVYSRIVMVGGGSLVRCHSLHQLCHRPPRPGDITHMFIDPWILNPSDPRHNLFTKFKTLNDNMQLNIQFLSYKYLILKIKQFPESLQTDFSIFNPKMQEMGRRDHELFLKQNCLKRPQDNVANSNANKRLKEADVVTLEDSDEDETPVVQTKVVEISTETGYVSQSMESASSEEMTTKVPDNDSNKDVDNEDIIVDDCDKQVTDTPPTKHDIDDGCEDSSDDDDIQILEQKLVAARQEAGGRRHYLETSKAVSSRNKVVSSSKRQSVYIPSQRDEYLRQAVNNVEMVTLDDSDTDEEDDPRPESDDSSDDDESVSEHQEDEVPDNKDDDIIEVPVPAPDIVNIDSDDDDEEERQSWRTSVDAEPDQEPLISKNVVQQREQVKVRSQREEFLLAAAEQRRRSEEDDSQSDFESASAISFLVGVERECNGEVLPSPVKHKTPIKLNKVDQQAEAAPNAEDFSEYEDLFRDPTDEVENSRETKNLDTDKNEASDGDESDFSIPDTVEVTIQPERVAKSTQSTKLVPCINIERLSQKMFDYHHKLAVDYWTRKAEISAPQVDDLETSLSERNKLVVNYEGNKKQSTSLLYRIIASLHKRFSVTQELLTLDLVHVSKWPSLDNHNELDSKKHQRQVTTIKQSVLIEVCNLVKTPTDDGDNDPSDTSDIEDEIDCARDFRKMDANFYSDSITCINRLKNETCSTAIPDSKVLNVLFRTLLMEESNIFVLKCSVDYINKLLFLHYNNPDDRLTWLSNILSALRNLKDEKLFRSFSFSNTQELVLCADFMKELIEKVIQNSALSRPFLVSHHIESSEEESLGPFMLLTVLVKILKRDFEIWWKFHASKLSDASENKTSNLPLLFYLLGGSERDLLKMIKSTILKLYKHFLRVDHPLTEVRTLIGMAATLVSHLDLLEDYGSLFWGDKRSLAMAVCDVYTEVVLPAETLYMEMFLLTPAWFSALVSHRMMARSNRQFEKLTTLPSLRPKLTELAQSCDINLLLSLDNFTHKLLSFQQCHSVFRAYWHHFKNSGSEFTVYKHLNSLEETGPKTKVIQFDSILFHLPTLTESIALLTDFANNRLSFLDNECRGDFDEIGALRALLFSMHGCDSY